MIWGSAAGGYFAWWRVGLFKNNQEKNTNPNNLPCTQTLLIAMYSLQVVGTACFLAMPLREIIIHDK